MLSSIRSRQTGQVGSSTREGVGGGAGFDDREVVFDGRGFEDGGGEAASEGVKGSWRMSGKESVLDCGPPENVMLRMKTTWRFSGYKKYWMSPHFVTKDFRDCA